MSGDVVTVTDSEALLVAEGLEVTMHGRGYVPYPATPGPAPRPEDGREERGAA